MVNIELNTSLINHIYSGGYGTIWDNMDDGLSWQEYYTMDNILEAYNDHKDNVLEVLQEIMPKIVDINFTSSYSPREYNFANDSLDFTLTVKNGFIRDLKNRVLSSNDFSQYLKDNYSSYDGFISFTPNNTGDFKTALDDKNNSEHIQALASAINYLLHKHITQARNDWDIEMTMFEDIRGNGYETIRCNECESEKLEYVNDDVFEGYICLKCKYKMPNP